MSKEEALQQRLDSFMDDIEKDEFQTYGQSTHLVKEIDVGARERFEIHYYEDGEEINEAFFIADGERIALDSDEIAKLSSVV